MSCLLLCVDGRAVREHAHMMDMVTEGEALGIHK